MKGRAMARQQASTTFDLDSDGAQYLAQVITYVRKARSVTRPEIATFTGLSRTLATKYIDVALELNLLHSGEVGQSTGGRAPRLLNFNSNAGAILVAELGASGFNVAASDLNGNLLGTTFTRVEISEGPEAVLSLVESSFDDLVASL